MFARLAKVALATAGTGIPALVPVYFPSNWTWPILFVYGVGILVAWWFVLEPDQRFSLVRNPTLDSAFATTFADDDFVGGDVEDHPFRVHVFEPFGFWWWRRLCMTYCYRNEIAHSDHGISWPKNHGLVWSVFNSGKVDFCVRGEPSWTQCRLSDKEDASTEQVKAVLAIPLRRPTRKRNRRVEGRVIGVLAFDSLSAEGAEALREQFKLYKENNNKKLLDRVDYVSLYFQ